MPAADSNLAFESIRHGLDELDRRIVRVFSEYLRFIRLNVSTWRHS